MNIIHLIFAKLKFFSKIQTFNEFFSAVLLKLYIAILDTILIYLVLNGHPLRFLNIMHRALPLQSRQYR